MSYGGTVHTIDESGYTIEIWHDPDCSNPREDNPEGEFVFLGFPHRSYKIGDETWDPDLERIECPDCHGSGDIENVARNATEPCERCAGWGYLDWRDPGMTLTDAIEAKAKELGAVLWRKVGMIDHSGVSYYLGGGPAVGDACCGPGRRPDGLAGVMFVTHDVINTRWGSLPGCYPVAPGDPGWETSPNNEAFLVECMRGDLQAYDDWASGNAYGFTVTDTNGDEIETCGGFLGDWGTSGILDEARACIPDEPSEKLHTVRLTADEIATLQLALGPGGVTLDDAQLITLYGKLEEAVR